MSALLGPPELRHPPPTPTPTPPPPSGNPFIDLMVTNYNSLSNPQAVPPQPVTGYTEKGSATFLATGNPCLDFFFHVVPSIPAQRLTDLLSSSWSHNPTTTLKLIAHLRGVRGTGKSDKEGYYTCALWLHKHHPKSLACNVAALAEFGYFKDLPELLFRVLEGEGIRKELKEKWEMVKGKKGKGKKKKRGVHHGNRVRSSSPEWDVMEREEGRREFRFGDAKRGNKRISKPSKKLERERKVKEAKERAEREKAKASELRHKKKADLAKKAINRYTQDPDFRFLHGRISDLFADKLKSDLGFLQSGNVGKISLAAKWCPSIDSSFDRHTLLCEAIARKVFPRESYLVYEGVEDEHYAYRVRDRLRKEVLVPLRQTLELPEVYMSANKWGTLPYNRVPSVAMKNYKEIFLEHDEARFKEYLASVEAGKSTIAAGALLPHEIVRSLHDPDGGQVAELQWKRMVEDMAKKGKLSNCIGVCDVSGSMDGEPMEVCVALGILVSELSEEPWKGKVITFSANPQLHLIEGEDLRERTRFVKWMDWGANTDFQKVFDLLLDVAVKGKLEPDQMIKRIFVFSDMEFDQALGGYPVYGGFGGYRGNQTNQWETDYMVIRKKYEEKGYGNAIPEIVFWNLRASRSIPVTGTQSGVALVSGFSKNLLKMFLDGGGIMNPEAVMEAAISGDEYKDLVVID